MYELTYIFSLVLYPVGQLNSATPIAESVQNLQLNIEYINIGFHFNQWRKCCQKFDTTYTQLEMSSFKTSYYYGL